MKVTISQFGVMSIEPESGVEAFALRVWCEKALVQVDDTPRRECAYWRGSMLVVGGYDKDCKEES